MGISVISKASCDPATLPIGVWLTPHPLDRESPFEIEWLKGLPGFDTTPMGEDGEPPLWRKHNVTLFESFREQVGNDFKVAMQHMWPMFDGYVIESISVFIDYLNDWDMRYSPLGYSHEYSEPQKGSYIFNISGGYLNDILLQLHSGQPADITYKYTWEHEIIHLRDHRELVKLSAFKEGNSSCTHFIYYKLRFRSEGIAELYYLLRTGFSSIRSIAEAKRLFVGRVQEVRQLCRSVSILTPAQTAVMENMNDFRMLGPWIMLSLLKSFEGRWHEDMITGVIHKLEQGEGLEHEHALIITQIALRMKSDTYLLLLKDYLINS